MNPNLNSGPETSMDISHAACQSRNTPSWLVWTITCVELLFLGGFAFALNSYWLMLPVWMRSVAATGLLALAALIVIRVIRFLRMRLKETSQCS